MGLLHYLREQEGAESYWTPEGSQTKARTYPGTLHPLQVQNPITRAASVAPNKNPLARTDGDGSWACDGDTCRTCWVLSEVHKEQMASASSGVFFFNCRSWAAWIRGSMV